MTPFLLFCYLVAGIAGIAAGLTAAYFVYVLALFIVDWLL